MILRKEQRKNTQGVLDNIIEHTISTRQLQVEDYHVHKVKGYKKQDSVDKAEVDYKKQ